MKRIVCLALTFFMLINTGFAMPFRGQSELLLGSGLTDSSRDVGSSESIFKNAFSADKKIIFWATVIKKKEDVMKYILSVEWYAPDGKIWYKENKEAFYSASVMFGGVAEKTIEFTLNTKNIPSDKRGVWAAKFIWNNSVISEYYFTITADPVPPTTDQINELKNKMRRYDHSIAISNKSNYYKLSSHFARNVKNYYKSQQVFRPDVVFSPDEQIIYMLNYDSTEFGSTSSFPDSNIYLFSPDGKLRKFQFNQWMYTNDADYIYGFRDKIDLGKLVGSNKDLYGIWKLICYIPNINQNFDERYFYIGDNPSVEITKDAIETLNKKIDENEIVKSLNMFQQNSRDLAIKLGRTKQSRIRVDVGMSKDEVLRLIGQPQNILTNKYDDAAVWVYTSISAEARDGVDSAVATNVFWDRTNLGTGLIAGGVVAGLCLIMPNKLEVVI